MAARKKKEGAGNSSGSGALGFEAKLWETADKLRGHMDAAEYKHVVLGLVFLKYVSDAFEERHQQLEVAAADPRSEYFTAGGVAATAPIAMCLHVRFLGVRVEEHRPRVGPVFAGVLDRARPRSRGGKHSTTPWRPTTPP